jgi:hypothetical protein
LDKDPRLRLGLDEREVYDFIAKNNIKMAKFIFISSNCITLYQPAI